MCSTQNSVVFREECDVDVVIADLELPGIRTGAARRGGWGSFITVSRCGFAGVPSGAVDKSWLPSFGEHFQQPPSSIVEEGCRCLQS